MKTKTLKQQSIRVHVIPLIIFVLLMLFGKNVFALDTQNQSSQFVSTTTIVK